MLPLRPLLCLLAALALAPAAFAQQAPAPAPSTQVAAPLKQPGKWAQDYLDRAADPAVLFGTLPNGLRYAILRNETPKDAVAMRMLIGSGSLKERDEERGIAHFLEHMAFRGSANVADGETVRMLERQGLRFGPDTNASTSQEQTLYMFNFPHADDAALDTGLKLFREIGERLTLDPAAIEAERGVILSEERLRDTPAYRAAKANVALLLQGTRAPERWAIGTVETIKATTAERMRRYYRANYRPDNATIVVVGAIDPAAVEAKIKAGFADWQADGPAEPFDTGAPVPQVKAAEFVASGAPDQLSLYWVGPVDERAETAARDRERLLRLVALAALNNRLSDRALQPGSPFAAARAGASDALLGTASVVNLSIQADPANWRPALAAVIEEQRMILRDGLSAEDFKRATTALLTRFKAVADGAATRRSEGLADSLADAAADGGLFTSPAQDLAFVEPVLAAMTPAEATQALRALFAGAPPLLFRSAHAEPATTAALELAFAQSQAAPLPAATEQAALSWPYADFGAPGAIVSRREDEALGATLVDFANGTRLIVKRTDFARDRVSVLVGFGAGAAGVPAELVHAQWAASLFPVGGTGRLSVPELRRFMQTQGKLASADANLDSRQLWLSGGTRPADFALQMQLLAALATDPGFRPELGDQLKTMAPMLKTRVDTDAGSVFSRGVANLLHGGDARFASLPADADIDATRAQDIAALIRPQLATPANVAIVGDIDVEDAIRVTAATLGALPRPARQPDPAVHIAMPAGREAPFVFEHGGRADQAVYGLFWQLPDYPSDPALSYVADVAAALAKARLVQTVRETLGLTYSPSAGAVASLELPGLGYFSVTAETPPEKFAAMRAAVLDVLAALARAPVDADELARARKPLVEAALKARESNDFWLQNLAAVLSDPRARDIVLQTPEALGRVSAAQVAALFKRHVIGKTPITAIARARSQ